MSVILVALLFCLASAVTLAQQTFRPVGIVRDLTDGASTYKGILDSLLLPKVPGVATLARSSTNPIEYGNRDKLDYWLNTELLTWEQAENACKAKGGRLARVSNDLTEKSILSRLIESETMWIGHKDGLAMDGVFQPIDVTYTDNEGCAAVQNDVGGSLQTIAENCFTEKLKSICTKETAARSTNKNVMYMNRYFVVEGDRLTWNTAKAECSRKGARLATFTDAVELDVAMNALVPFPNAKAYVGLYKDAQGVLRNVDGAIATQPASAPGVANQCLSFNLARTFEALSCDAFPETYTVALCESIGNHLWTNRGAFWVMQEPATFQDAKVACEQAGGSLASITNANEQAIVLALTQKLDGSVWIGVDKASSSAPTSWLDGSSMSSFNNWKAGEATADIAQFPETCLWKTVFKRHFFPRTPVCVDEDLGIGSFFQLPIEKRAVRYLVNGKPALYYRRYTSPSAGQAQPDKFILNFAAEFHKVNDDFDLFSTEKDMHAKTNPWKAVAVNTDGTGGFPMQSGPTSPTQYSLRYNDCQKSATFEFCEAKKLGCGVFSPETGEWSFGTCFEKRAFVCRQDNFFDKLPIAADVQTSVGRIEGLSDTVWRVDLNTTQEEASSICEQYGQGELVTIKTAEQRAKALALIDNANLIYYAGVNHTTTAQGTAWFWQDGDLFTQVGVSPLVPGQSVVFGRTLFRSSPWGYIMCSKQRHTPPSGTSPPEGRVANALSGASSLAYLLDGSLVVGNAEHGLLEKLDVSTGAYQELEVGGARSGMGFVASSCQSYGIEPHRFYCFDLTSCPGCTFGFNIPGLSHGPTALTVHPVTGNLFIAVQKVGKGSFLGVVEGDKPEDYIGSLIYELTETEPGKYTPVLFAGGGTRRPSKDLPVAAKKATFGWVNGITFNVDGSTMYVSDRDGRGVYYLDVDTGVFSLLVGRDDITPSATFVNDKLPAAGTSEGLIEIGVPQFIKLSKTTDRRLYIATLLVNDAQYANQQYHILQVDHDEDVTSVQVSYPLASRLESGKSGIGSSDTMVYFEEAISGIEIDSFEVMYIAQRETSSLFAVDLSEPASSGKMQILDVKTVDGKRRSLSVRANSILLNPSETKLLLGSMYEFGVQPLRIVHLPVRQDGPSLMIDDLTGDCSDDLTVSDFFLFLDSIKAMVSGESFDAERVHDLIKQGQVCTSAFVADRRSQGFDATVPEKRLIDDIKTILNGLEGDEDVLAKSKADLAYMEILWNWFLSGSFVKYPSPVPPPPPQLRYGKALADTSSLEKYRLMVEPESNDGMKKSCRSAMVTAAVCECGSIYRTNKCEEIKDDAEMANFYSLVAYCAHGDELKTRADDMAIPMLFWAAECVQLDVWKPGSQPTNYGLLEVISELLKAAGTTIVARNVQNGPLQANLNTEIDTLVRELTASKKRMVEDVSLMNRFNAVSVARLDTVCLQKGCKANVDLLLDDLNLELTAIDIKQGTSEVSAKITEATDTLLDNLENLGDVVTANFENLAQLTADLTTTLSKDIATKFTTMADNFEKDKTADADNLSDDLSELKLSFQNGISAILEDKNIVEEYLDSMKKGADALGPVVKDFYECKKKQELAELARKRAFAIFDVVKGAFQVVAEVGAFIASGGASSAAKAAVRAGQKGIQALGKAKSFVKRAASRFRSGYRTKPKAPKPPRKKPTTVEEVKQDSTFERIVDTLGANEELIDSAAEKIIDATFGGGGEEEDTANKIVGFMSSTFEVLGAVGVPGADGMATVLGGVQVLMNYEGQKEEIEKGFQQNMAKSQAAFKELAAFALEIGEFFTELVLEFYHVMDGELPEVSSIEGRSTSFWESIQKELIYFIQRTDMYIDFQGVAGRRLSSDERLLDTPLGEPQLLAGEAELVQEEETSMTQRLRSRALVQSPNPMASTDNFRRALGDKDGCPDSDLRRHASTGLEIFNRYMLDIEQAVLSGKTMHVRMVDMMEKLREVRSKSRQLEAAKDSAERWKNAKDTFSQVPDTAVLLNDFKGSLLTFKRSAPEVLGRRDPQVFTAMRNLQAKTLSGTCTASWYADLSNLNGCGFTSAQVFQNGRTGAIQFNNLKQILEGIKDDFQDARATGDVAREDWFRIPVATTLEMKAQLEGTTIDDTKSFQFNLHDLPEEFDGCGYNMEIRHRVFLLESNSDVDVAHLPAFESRYTDISLGAKGPFLKLDKQRQRHVFDIKLNRDAIRTRVKVFKKGEDGFDDCGSPNFDVESFSLRDRLGTKLCVEQLEMDPLPVMGTYDISLDDKLAEFVRNGNDDTQLVMYAKLSVKDLTDNCVANNFRALTNDPPALEESGSDVGLIVGLSVAGVVLLAGSAFVAKKYGSQIKDKFNSRFRSGSGSANSVVMTPKAPGI